VKLGVVTTSYPRTPGDPAGSFVHAHVESLRALGHDVDVISGVGDALFDRGGAPDYLEARPRALLEAAWFSARMLARVVVAARRWDGIVAHWLAPSALAALPTRVPLLAIAHGGDIHTLRRLRLLAPTLWLLHRRRAELVFVSEELRAMARAAAPSLSSWLAEARVQPMGLDLARFAKIERAPDRIVLFVGRLVPIKGVHVLLSARRYMRTTNVRIVIAGDGPARAALERQAREHGRNPDRDPNSERLRDSGPSVEFLGAVDPATRDGWFARAGVVVVPSRVLKTGRSEGMPVVVLEALAAGVPVVGSDVGGLSSLARGQGDRVPDGDLVPVSLVPPEDPRALAAAIDRVLAATFESVRAGALEEQVAAARAVVAGLDWCAVGPRLVPTAQGTIRRSA
jgi:glycosyltransferase involved in cell wall biosynthesis